MKYAVTPIEIRTNSTQFNHVPPYSRQTLKPPPNHPDCFITTTATIYLNFASLISFPDHFPPVYGAMSYT